MLQLNFNHNRFTALFPGPPGWAGARRELLDFMVQGEINRGRHTDHPAGRHSIRTNQFPPLPSPHIFFKGRMPFLPPNRQCQSTEGNSISSCVYKYNYSWLPQKSLHKLRLGLPHIQHHMHHISMVNRLRQNLCSCDRFWQRNNLLNIKYFYPLAYIMQYPTAGQCSIFKHNEVWSKNSTIKIIYQQHLSHCQWLPFVQYQNGNCLLNLQQILFVLRINRDQMIAHLSQKSTASCFNVYRS